jgi:hypothetical protein
MEVLFANLSLNSVVPHAELEPLDRHSSAAPCSSLSQSSLFRLLFMYCYVLAGFTVNECRQNTAKTVTPWTQSEYRYHPPAVQVKQKVILASSCLWRNPARGTVPIDNTRRSRKQTLAAKTRGEQRTEKNRLRTAAPKPGKAPFFYSVMYLRSFRTRAFSSWLASRRSVVS